MLSTLRALIGQRGHPGDDSPVVPDAGARRASRASEVRTLREQGRLAEAIACVQEWLAGSPGDADAKLQLAAVLLDWGRVHEARAVLADITANGPLPEVQLDCLGSLLMATGNTALAASILARAADDHAGARRGLCLALREQGRHEECIACCDDVLEGAPGDVDVMLVRCLAYASVGDSRRAGEAILEVLRLDPENAVALFALALLRKSRKEYVEAIELVSRAMASDRSKLPHRGHVDLAILQDLLGLHEAALETLLAGLDDGPTPEVHRALGQQLLAAGRFAQGWAQHEYRWFIPPLRETRMRGDLVAWEGESLTGKTILLRVEQGFGDTIQFMRYAPSLKALGARVIMGNIELANRYLGVDGVVGADVPLASVDCYVNLMSLPRVFGTDLATIPLPIPYVRTSVAHLEEWSRYFRDMPRPRVGLVWAGSTRHVADAERSIPLASFASMVEGKSATFLSLQKEIRTPTETELLACRGIADLAPRLSSYDDTVAVLENLDLLITVDTSVAHLAGALGRPVWVLLAKPADWRWLHDREDSPWYPTMRLFRQDDAGDWAPVLKRVGDALARFDRPSQAGERSFEPRVVPVKDHAGGDDLRSRGVVLHRRDTLLQYVPDRGVVERSLQRSGEYLPIVIDVLASFGLHGAVVVEVNAAPGHHTIPLARLAAAASGHVIAFESRPGMARLLGQSLHANEIANVSVIDRRLAGPGHDDCVDRLGLSRLDVLKVGVDEDTLSILAGAEQSLWGRRPRIVVEVLGESTASEVGRWIKDRAYRVWKLTALADTDVACLLALPEESDEVDTVASAGFAELRDAGFNH